MSDDADVYVVWSNEHSGWWRAGARGYSRALPKAARYTREHALRICREAIPTAAHIGMISEIPVRLADLNAVLHDQLVPAAIMKDNWEN